MNVEQRLDSFATYLTKYVAPNRAIVNTNKDKLFEVFYAMVKHHVLGMWMPNIYGGMDLDNIQQHRFIVDITRASGALMLLQTQHQSVQRLIASFADEEFCLHWLPPSCDGSICFGIGFSHLHQNENCQVRAVDHGDYYLVSGKINYATGYGLYNWLALGFICEEEEIITLIPFTMQDGFSFGRTLPLVACFATQTITFELTNFKVPKTHIICKQPIGMHHYRSIRSKQFLSIHIGTMLAVLDLLDIKHVKQQPMLQQTIDKLNNKIIEYTQKALVHPLDEITAPLRIEGLLLLQQIIFFADQVFRGKALLNDHPLNLLKQEAQLFAALASEGEMLKATCENMLQSK